MLVISVKVYPKDKETDSFMEICLTDFFSHSQWLFVSLFVCASVCMYVTLCIKAYVAG